MSAAEGVSLLGFLDAPVLVGDPEGRIIYANPAFIAHFCEPGEDLRGESLASRFVGGGREAVLSAVARVCSQGETARFRLREEGHGYLGLASPIEADDDRVGVMILLTEEPAPDERLLAYQGEIDEPLRETISCLEELIEQTGGRRSERYRGIVERGIDAAERARKWSDELHALLGGGSAQVTEGRCDTLRVLRHAEARLDGDLDERNLRLRTLVPSRLPHVYGSAPVLERMIVQILQARAAQARPGSNLCLLARDVSHDGVDGVLVSVVDLPAESALAIAAVGGRSGPTPDGVPDAVRRGARALGGRLITLSHPSAGRVTSLLLRRAGEA